MGNDNIIPFKVEHLQQMDIKDVSGMEVIPDNYKMMEGQHAATLLSNGNPIACVGIIPLVNGVGEVWTVTDKCVGSYPLLFHKFILNLLSEMDSLGFHRLQAICAMLHNSGKWLEKLGFKKEGIMKQFGPNREDFCLYGRVK